MGWLVSGMERNRSVVFIKNFSEDDFVLGKDLGSEKKRKHGRG